MLLQAFLELKRRYWGSHFWGNGYGCWGTGHITEDMLESYLNQRKDQPNNDDDFILE
jgi:putative transposase